MILDTGRVCRKVRGRDAGNYCVVLERADGGRVIVEGRGVKKGKVSVRHIEPLPVVLKITKKARSATIIKALEKEGF